MPNPVASEFRFRCPTGHRFSLPLTPQQFVDNDHCCPECGKAGKRALFAAGLIASGTVVPGLRAEYPYHNWQLPLLPGMKPGEQIVQSRSHEREIMAGGWGDSGQRYERNAI